MSVKGQLPKAYLRVDPNLDQTHPDPGGFVQLLCAAARQPARGRFKSRALLDTVLGKRLAKRLVDRADLVEVDGRWYVAGWDEWQEGDLTVGERQRRIRDRRVTPPLRDRDTAVTEPLENRDSPSEAVRQQGSEALEKRIGAYSLGSGPPRTNGRSKQPTNEKRLAELRDALESTNDQDLRMGIEETIRRLEAHP